MREHDSLNEVNYCRGASAVDSLHVLIRQGIGIGSRRILTALRPLACLTLSVCLYCCADYTGWNLLLRFLSNGEPCINNRLYITSIVGTTIL